MNDYYVHPKVSLSGHIAALRAAGGGGGSGGYGNTKIGLEEVLSHFMMF